MKETNLYVSPCGNDGWIGHKVQPDDNLKDGPLASPAGARDRIRSLKRKGQKGAFRVILRGGDYVLSEPLVFLPEDSGTADAPVTYCAYEGEQPLISGGMTLENWKKETFNGKDCWVAKVPGVKRGGWYFKELFVNGIRRPRSRFPKKSFYYFADLPDGREMGPWHAPVRRAFYKPGEIKKWKNMEDVELVTLQFWFDGHMRIAGVDEQKNLVTFTSNSIGNLAEGADGCARYFMENVAEALTEPGEWYLDRKAAKVYYLPKPGEEPGNVTVTVPRLNFLVRFMGGGEVGQPKVSYLRFENLAFAYSEYNFNDHYTGSVQASHTTPGAIQLRGSEHCVLFGCTVSRVGQYAVEIQQGSHANRILACTLNDLGAGGVKVFHECPYEGHDSTVDGIASCSQPFTKATLEEIGLVRIKDYPYDKPGTGPAKNAVTEIADCHIHDGGKLYPSAVGVLITDSGRNHVHHNEIHDFFYTAISVGWLWGYKRSCAVANLIEHNHLYNLGKGILSDMGAIYLLGPQPGTVVRGNVIHDIRCYSYGGWGLYPDQGASYMLFENNIAYRCQCGGFHQNWARDNMLRNNIFATGEDGLIIRGREECARGMTIKHNIVYSVNAPIYAGAFTGDSFAADHNLYWQADGGPLKFSGYGLREWNRMGHDLHSTMADPLFQDPLGGNFTLRPDSPAMAVGFKPFKTEAGPRYGAKRPLTLSEIPVVKPAAVPVIQSTLEISEKAKANPAIEEYRKLAFIPLKFALPFEDDVPMSLTLENRGFATGTGKVRIHAEPATAAVLKGKTTFRYSLKPGAILKAEFTFRMKKGVDTVWLEVTPQGKGLMPTALRFVPEPDYNLPAIPGSIGIDGVEAALKEVPARHLRTPLYAIGSIKLGVTSEAVLVDAIVNDAGIKTVEATPWGGFGLEAFFRKTGELVKQTQFFILPQTKSQPAKVLLWKDLKTQAMPGVQVETRPVEGGYHLVARIPFREVDLADGSTKFQMEINMLAHPESSAPCVGSGVMGVISEVAVV